MIGNGSEATAAPTPDRVRFVPPPPVPPRQPSTRPTRGRRVPTRHARSTANRAARTTRSAPPWPPTSSSPSASRPPQHTNEGALVRKFRYRRQQSSRSTPRNYPEPQKVSQVRSNLRTADATRHEMRYGSQLRTSLALSNPVPNVLDELTHVLCHVEVLTRYHTNSEL